LIPARASRLQLAAVLLLLVVLQFYLRPRLWGPRGSPDFLFVGLMLYAMRASPGAAAVAGFLVGLVTDSLSPARFGAGALAHTLVAYTASWARGVFFADNLLVNAAFIAVGLWLRDLIVLAVSGLGDGSFLTELAVYSPLQALSSAVFALVMLMVVREWLSIRLDA
jgi:rod shape-determining protein MreD